MAVQMFPIQEIGKMLSSSQGTEELPQNSGDDGEKSDPTASFQKVFLPAGDFTSVSSMVETRARAYIHSSDQIPSNHSTDVVSPPPDILA